MEGPAADDCDSCFGLVPLLEDDGKLGDEGILFHRSILSDEGAGPGPLGFPPGSVPGTDGNVGSAVCGADGNAGRAYVPSRSSIAGNAELNWEMEGVGGSVADGTSMLRTSGLKGFGLGEVDPLNIGDDGPAKL